MYDPLPARRVPVACPGDVSQGDAVFARRLPLQMRSVPRGSEEKRRQAGENRKKTEKSRKKVLEKFGNPAKSATFAVPFGKGALGAPPRIGGSSLNRKKEARAGPADPAPTRRGEHPPGERKKTKIVLNK